ncbi:plastidic glucose transporter 4-like [Gossypium australe]|uniref:Plastidic glucose transporter 4-like n=1 Tax=Gossypium australe TaxID=47621 RepID=A0A5B6UME3_9ROSI|nr:plastidic glucose transporter 4-like [Gossypium australe]
MQASTHLVRGNFGIEISKRRVFPCFGEVRQRSLTLNRNFCIRSGSTCSGLRSGDVSMGAGLVRAKNGIETAVRSSVKSRSIKAQASGEENCLMKELHKQIGGDIEDLTPINPQAKSSGAVLPFVGVACLGAMLFGYHLGVVNGALEYLSKDLGIAENTGGLSAHSLLVPLLVHLLGEHWQTNLAGQGLFN